MFNDIYLVNYIITQTSCFDVKSDSPLIKTFLVHETYVIHYLIMTYGHFKQLFKRSMINNVIQSQITLLLASKMKL
jgi:hypothetical protein